MKREEKYKKNRQNTPPNPLKEGRGIVMLLTELR